MTDMLTAPADVRPVTAEPGRPPVLPIATAFSCPEGGDCTSNCGALECARVAFGHAE
jgi:hypothetical protein